jgi:ABC-2 type transport system permease protein
MNILLTPSPRAQQSSKELTSSPSRGWVRSARLAFLAILRRDLLVTWRDITGFLLQVLLQPIFFLFIFGKILPAIGVAQQGFAGILLPGLVAFTVIISAIQSVALPLVLDLGFAREIDDRILAPIPVSLVALEKAIFAALRGLVAGASIFPLAYLILGGDYHVRSDAIGIIIGIMLLAALAGAGIGLAIGTIVKPDKIGIMFALIFTPLIFTGCIYYPWGNLGSIKWFQIITLCNPLTYASEGLRYTMVPGAHGQPFPTLGIGWTLVGLCIAIAISLTLGVTMFHKRVVS